MTDKAWKRQERNVARRLDAKRNPLSGRAGGHTSADVIHPVLYVEVKHAKRFAVLTIMREVEHKAAKEKKLPVLVLHQKGARRRYVLITESHFVALLQDSQHPPH